MPGSAQSMKRCRICESPARDVWVLHAPKVLELVQRGNWIEIDKCPECDQLWCQVAYEPYASFPYWVAWKYAVEDFRFLHDLDDGNTLNRWHECAVSRGYPRLPDEDKKRAEAHDRRAWYGGAPIRANIAYCPDIEALLKNRSSF